MGDDNLTFDANDRTNPAYYGPSQTAFLLLDFHTMFVQHSGPSATLAVAVAAKFKRWAASQGILVIHVLIDTSKPPFPTCKDGRRYQTIISAMESSNTTVEPAELIGDAEEENLTFLRRPGHISALRSPGLMELLAKKGMESLLLAGLSTSGCVLRTASQATDEDFVVTVLRDGCADAKEGLHDMLMDRILDARGYVFTAEYFQELYEKIRNPH
ncbi:Isochorismatase hydrolase [Aureobasidium sp. EXF-8846]|nr:Isochorismatase hydrolase [Aureobasidium sp. EXF-8846]